MNDVTKPRRARDPTLRNPLANWGNDDLLIEDEAQRTVAKSAPKAFRVLDWPGLRDSFEKHDHMANQAKKKLNRHGMTGAMLSTIGASLLALSPLLPSSTVQNLDIVMGCSFVLLGAIMGLWHLRGHTSRARWLLARLRTERLRQFHFQYVINNLDAAILAMRDDSALRTYQSLRDGALLAFLDDLEKNISARSFSEAIRWIADDHEDAYVWCQSIWQNNDILSGNRMTTEHRELFECLSQRRIGIQEIYAQSNLKKNDNSSQASMSRQNFVRGNVATLVFVLFLTLAGLWILVGGIGGRVPSEILIALSGVAAAWGLFFRLVNQGMGYSLDTERYELYSEQVALVRQRFNDASENLVEKVRALRQLELYAYGELRQFLRTHLQSQFLA